MCLLKIGEIKLCMDTVKKWSEASHIRAKTLSISSEILVVNISHFFYSSFQIRKMLAQICLFSTFILQMQAHQVDLDPPFPGADQPCYQEVRK